MCQPFSIDHCKQSDDLLPKILCVVLKYNLSSCFLKNCVLKQCFAFVLFFSSVKPSFISRGMLCSNSDFLLTLYKNVLLKLF